jgi:hypothetical protein
MAEKMFEAGAIRRGFEGMKPGKPGNGRAAPASPAQAALAQRKATEMSPQLYQRGYAEQQAQAGRATRALPQVGQRASVFGPPIGTVARAGAQSQQVLIDPNAFVAALQAARVKAGGVNRLACYITTQTGEVLDQSTVFAWLKGRHLPRQKRMAQLYALFTAR